MHRLVTVMTSRRIPHLYRTRAEREGGEPTGVNRGSGNRRRWTEEGKPPEPPWIIWCWSRSYGLQISYG